MAYGLPVGGSWSAVLLFVSLGLQPGPHPAPLALRIVPDVRVSHDRQLPGDLFGGRSQGAHAVDDYLGAFVGQDIGCQFPDPIEWQVDGARQVDVLVVPWVQSLDEENVPPRSIFAFSSSRPMVAATPCLRENLVAAAAR